MLYRFVARRNWTANLGLWVPWVTVTPWPSLGWIGFEPTVGFAYIDLANQRLQPLSHQPAFPGRGTAPLSLESKSNVLLNKLSRHFDFYRDRTDVLAMKKRCPATRRRSLSPIGFEPISRPLWVVYSAIELQEIGHTGTWTRTTRLKRSVLYQLSYAASCVG